MLTSLYHSVLKLREYINRTRMSYTIAFYPYYRRFVSFFAPYLPFVKKRLPPYFSFIESVGVFSRPFLPIIDLAALSKNHEDMKKCLLPFLQEKNITRIVLMEDREPIFFLNYQQYSPDSPVHLSDHARDGTSWSQRELKEVVAFFAKYNIDIIIGFWGHFGFFGPSEQNIFMQENKEALAPILIGSDDCNPLVTVNSLTGKTCSFSTYIGDQYTKLVEDFGFKGLFLGDGLMGYRSFLLPHSREDFSHTTRQWTAFYKTIYETVHAQGGELYAYDMQGASLTRARRAGIDYEALSPYLDYLIFQSYGNIAWRLYLRLPFCNHHNDVRHFFTLPEYLRKKTYYSLELGDSVEGWSGEQWAVKRQYMSYARYSAGAAGVWSNDLFTELLKKGD